MLKRLIFPALLAVTACVTPEPETRDPALTTAEVARRLPGKAKDRDGWAADLVAAIVATDKEPTAERVCAVVAVIEQESGFQPNPAVNDLPRIVRDGLLAKLAPLGGLAEPALAALLSGKQAGQERTFAQRIDRLRTERDLDRLFRDLAKTYGEKLPGPYLVASALSRLLGKGALQDLNPVTTAGSMQVKVAFAKTLPENAGLPDDDVREWLYSRAGGVRAGTARLLAYPAAYDDVLYRFADYNAGVYASRNAQFQALLAEVTSRALTLDGDLLAYEPDGDTKDLETRTLQAMLAFGRSHDLWDLTVRRGAKAEKTAAFEEATIWTAVRDTWETRTGKKAPYARVPQVELASPKLRTKRSTAWFATSVKKRYEACRAR